jgi:hypothetical protein
MTMSHRQPISGSRNRSNSRIRRLARFRLTAFPNARGTVKPSRGPSSGARSSWRQKAEKYRPVNRIPFSYTRRNSGGRRILALFGNLKPVGVQDAGRTAELTRRSGPPSRR